MPFCHIVGHERVKELLIRGMKNARVSHAYLFLGPEGAGKRHLALAFAKALNCAQGEGDYCDRCPPCRKTDALCHPDVHVVEPQGSSLKIDQVRELQRELSFKAWEGRYKILIVDQADKLTPEASNALLKTLEEPSPATVIILISISPFSLLPTVLSRCQPIRFGPLRKEEIAQVLRQRHAMEAPRARVVASLCGGKVGQALTMDWEATLTLREQAWDLLRPKEGPATDLLFRKTRELSKNRDEVQGLMLLLSSLTRDVVVLACGGDASFLIHEDLAPPLDELAVLWGASRALKVWEIVERTQGLLRHNVSGQLALESMLVEIHRFLEQ